MTMTKPQHTVERASRQARSTNMGRTESVDACELLLAELKSRRARIRELLHLVRLEAEHLPARRAAACSRPKCENVRTRCAT